MNIDLVVFDMAGTTVNDADGVNRSVREALASVGISVSREAVNRVMGIPKPEALRILIEQSPAKQLLDRLDEIHTDFVGRMIRFYQTDPSVYEIPGASETFGRLRRAGIRVTLDTGFNRQIADTVLRRLGWLNTRLLDATVTSDEVARGRPHPDMIERLMRDLGVSDPKRVAKVGDTPSDLQQGTSAGCGMVVGVCGGSHTAEQLAPYPHTHLIASAADFPGLLGL
jgi:phosphonatase-like hydrolase